MFWFSEFPLQNGVFCLFHTNGKALCIRCCGEPLPPPKLLFFRVTHTLLCYYLIKSEVTAFLPFKLLHPQSRGLLLHPLAKQLFGVEVGLGVVMTSLSSGKEKRRKKPSPVKGLFYSWAQPWEPSLLQCLCVLHVSTSKIIHVSLWV